ncbi:MAG: HU family DNA-binding protein [Clostridia bacterium]|nr:HU family DNA-binding protein [Clostridia bacterium]
MNKAEFLKDLQENGNYNSVKEASQAYDAFVATILKALKEGEKIQLAGFGTFEVKERAGRICQNPKTGEKVEVAACKVPAFKFGASFKALIEN